MIQDRRRWGDWARRPPPGRVGRGGAKADLVLLSERSVDHLVVEMRGKHSDQLSGGVAPMVLACAEAYGRLETLGNVGFDLDLTAGSMHGDGDGQIAEPLAEAAGAFEPIHQLATM